IIDVESGELRLVHVRKRDAVTLCREIRRHVAPGTVIVTDEWAAYRRIPTLRDNNGAPLNFTHMTVNHRNNFVNPVTRAHMQSIEQAWGPANLLLLRNMRGWCGCNARTARGRAAADRLMQTYLDWCWWQSMNGPAKCKDPFLRLLDVIARHYKQA
ncbi:unnamed protein product, partial [Ixodes hexagonus]